MLDGSLDGREVWGEWIHVCLAESLHCSPETITILLITYTPIENKTFNFKKVPSDYYFSFQSCIFTS